MNPKAYDWMPGPTKGSHIKWLGSFTERNTRIGFVKLDAGATFEGGMQDSIELLFMSRGRVSAQGREYAQHTAFEFLAGEGPSPIKALHECEFLRIVLPKFDQPN
jgi:hypothetical protein